MSSAPLIPDRGEFVDALCLLRRGYRLVRAGSAPGACRLGGGVLYHSWEPLAGYGLLDEVDAPAGNPSLRCYRLSARGWVFSARVCREWRRRPLWQRLAVRLTG